MKQICYEVIFKATETLQNGNERTVKKSVLSPTFRTTESGKVHITEAEREAAGIKILESEHYYNIEYIETKRKKLLWIE